MAFGTGFFSRRTKHAPESPAGPPTAELDWRYVPAAETADHPRLLHELNAKQFDGMLVTGVFTPDEVSQALERLAAVSDGWTPEPFGAMLGMPLNHLGDHAANRDPYLDDTDACRDIYLEVFGFDPHQRIADVLQPMAEGLQLVAPTEDGRSYNPGNLRTYEPGLGGLRAHVGNEFIDTSAPGAMRHLLSTTRTRDHMSYFVVLQPSLEGGDLSVYDLLFVDHPTHERRWDGTYRDDAWFDELSCLRLSPGPGDMILFGGGWRWHRVDPIEGSIPRITYGGFASPSLDGERIHFWC